MSEAITRGVAISVRPFYVAERSDPSRDYYFFAYRVRIANVGEETVQLISRHWIITDGEDHSGQAMAYAEKARDMGVRIFTIGIGRDEDDEITSIGH